MPRLEPAPTTVSVVIITAGRLQCLPPCLASLRRQTYRPLEVVVVVGPSRDGSIDYAATLADAKVHHVDRLNVAHARNEGVRQAAGDIVAFLDDDAVASPTWLEEIVGVFEAEGPSCGGVAGMVVNENGPGRPVQALHNTINDLGEPVEHRLAPGGFDDPEGGEFTYFMGANMAFRREAILAVGGFDETYYYLYEDADMSVSVLRAGYALRYHPRALVHHLPAPSHNRRGPYDLNYRAFARQQLYFALKHSRRPASECLWRVARTKVDWLRIYAHQVRHHQMSWRDAARHARNAALGLAGGWAAGRRRRRAGATAWLPADLPRPAFRPLPEDVTPRRRRRTSARDRLRVSLLCGEFGGPVFGGVGASTRHLAESLALRGVEVVVLRTGDRPSRIEPDGYEVVDVPPSADPAASRHAFLVALRRLHDRRPIDVVEAPLWNGEGAAVGAAARWPLVLQAQTPSEVTRRISGAGLDADALARIAAERLQLSYAAGVIANSRAVIPTVEEAYGIPLATHGRRLAVIPHGMPGAATLPRRPIEAPDAGGTRFLFVGRLEARKGVLELGEAFAEVARRDPAATLWVVGADNGAGDGFTGRHGTGYVEAMRAPWPGDVAARVHFFGAIDDEAKHTLFDACDVFVAPSRYESFGLIYLEAMRCARPVIGTDVGGVPEVVEDGRTGLLVPAGAPGPLAEAMLRLGADPALRARLGADGRRRFEERFSLDAVARETERFYREVLEEWHGHAPSRAAAPRGARATAASPSAA